MSKKDLELMSDLQDVLENGEVILCKNSTINGEIRVKRGGMKEGLIHLISHRISERALNKKTKMDVELAKTETTAVLFLAINNINKAPAIKEKNGNYGIYHKGIKTIITKDKKGHYVLSGYDNKETKKEATESINAVIAQYGNTPEFLGIYAQVGAVISSNHILPQAEEKSRKILSQPLKIEVNGKERTCQKGLLEGFKNAVTQLDNLTQEYNELAENYKSVIKERNELQEKLFVANNKRNKKEEIEY